MDETGNVSAEVVLPDLPDGDHTVVLTGAGVDAEPRVMEIAITISRSDRFPREPLFLGAAAILLIIGLMALFIDRRRAAHP
ncbi:MAG: hypothetical protein DHS20C19_01510 [Acidimicrobiales bacterium]|nr:MAG: hypothetical protein DHS20C19_01510 [Acidimicrobiales bacterium]